MESFRVKQVLAGIGVILLIIISIAGVVSFARNLSSNDETADEPVVALVLSDYDDNESFVRMTYGGEVYGQDKHRAVRVTVDATERKYELLEGYNGKVLEKKTYRNNPDSYGVFLRSLEIAGFLDEKSSSYGEDERGVCAFGTRTVVELYNNNNEISRLWDASCKRNIGTLNGETRNIVKLFQNQITDYRELTRGVRFY